MVLRPLRQLPRGPGQAVADAWLEQLSAELADPKADRPLITRRTLAELAYPGMAANYETAINDAKLPLATRAALLDVLEEAHKTLSNDERRAEYDARVHGRRIREQDVAPAGAPPEGQDLPPTRAPAAEPPGEPAPEIRAGCEEQAPVVGLAREMLRVENRAPVDRERAPHPRDGRRLAVARYEEPDAKAFDLLHVTARSSRRTRRCCARSDCRSAGAGRARPAPGRAACPARAAG